MDTLIEMLADSPEILHGFDIVVLHIGTNDFGDKQAWKKYKEFQEGYITLQDFNAYICNKLTEPSIDMIFVLGHQSVIYWD